MHLERLRWVQLAAKGTRQTFAAKSLGKLWTAFRRCCSLIFFWRLDSSILMLLLSDTLVLRVFVWPEHGRASCAMWALYPLSDRGSIFLLFYRKGHCFMSWLWRSDGYWRTGSSSSMTSGRPSHQSFKRGLQLQRFHAAMAMTVRLWISSSKNWTSHEFDFDRPVYCRQTVFRLKFRLFCRLYTVGRL